VSFRYLLGETVRRSIVAGAIAASVTAAIVGPLATSAMAEPLPVVSETVTVDPNKPIVPGGLLDVCVTPKSLGGSQACIRI